MLCSIFLSAQKLVLTISSDTISTDDEFVVTLSGEMQNFSSYATLPDVPGLITVSHSESFNYNSSNKAATIRQTYTMKAISAGDYKIGAAWIQNGSKRIFSNQIQLHVLAGENPLSNGTVFMRLIPEKSTVYTGEKVRAFLYVYSSPEYSVSGDYPIATSYSGFWSQADDDFPEGRDTVVYINGERFNRTIIKSEYLYPNVVGNVLMPEYTYSCYLSKNDDDVYSWDSYESSFDLKSEPTTITVIDLPPHDSLPGWSGDVGQYNMKCTYSNDTTNCWDPIILTMYITGKGNFQFMSTPQLSLPPGMRSTVLSAYDSTTYEYDVNDNYDYKATEFGKVYKYRITPEAEGDFNLSAVAFTYFDPKKDQYVTIQSDSFALHVNPGQKIQSDSVNNLPDSFFDKKGKKEDMANVIFLCIALALIPVGAFVFYRYRSNRKKKQEAAKKEEERLAKLAENAEYVPPPDTTIDQANALIHGAGQYLQTGMVVPAVNNLYEALVIRLTGITKMRREEISVNSLRYKLRSLKFDQSLIDSTIEQYEDLMLKRYTMTSAQNALVHGLIARTADLINKLG
jgi:hypothetical protein